MVFWFVKLYAYPDHNSFKSVCIWQYYNVVISSLVCIYLAISNNISYLEDNCVWFYLDLYSHISPSVESWPHHVGWGPGVKEWDCCRDASCTLPLRDPKMEHGINIIKSKCPFELKSQNGSDSNLYALLVISVMCYVLIEIC